jgi:hypothetical protein
MRQLHLPADVLLAEAQAARRPDAAPILKISAQYSFKNWYDSHGKLRKYACRMVGISPHEMVLIVPVIGRTGAGVAVECEEFGELEGTVGRTATQGFTVKIKATDEERARLAGKIAWHEKFQKQQTIDKRQHKRLVPNNPLSSLIMADGSCIRCFVIDMSVSGVAVSADVLPPLGTPLAVGKIVGRVVRHTAEGFAVKFVETLAVSALERMIIQPPK